VRSSLAIRFVSVVAFISLIPVVARAQNTISTLAGGGNPNALATPNLGSVTSVVEDKSNNVYISVAAQHLIFILNGSGTSVYAGTAIAGFSGDGGAATAAMLDYPQGLAVDTNGNLFIADTYNNRIRRVDAQTGVITTVAGSSSFNGPQSGSFGGDGGPAVNAILSQPSGVAFDAAGNLYICDTFNSVIRRVSAANQTITTIAGNPNARGNSGDGGPALSALLTLPSRVAVDSNGNVYIADNGNGEIRQVNGATQIIETIATLEVGGVATDTANNVYATDLGNHLVVRFTFNPASGQFTETVVAGDDQQGFNGDGGFPTSASLNVPNDVFVDAAGDVLIADTGNERVRFVTPGTVAPPAISTLVGGGNPGDNGNATSALLSAPGSLTIRPGFQDLVISDAVNQRLRDIQNPTSATPQITTLAGMGIAGFTGDGIPATQSTIQTFPLTFPGLNDFTEGLISGQITSDASNNIFIADAGSPLIRRVDGTTGIMTIEAGIPNSFCFAGGCGDGGASTSASFAIPIGVAVDASGNVYIADFSQNRIRKADTMGNINNFAGTGAFCTNFAACGDGGPAASAEFGNLAGLAVDPAGNLLIADSFDGRIRRVTPNGSSITTIAFNGQQADSGDGGPALSASMDIPTALAVDAAGNIFVSSNFEADVRRIDAATGTVVRVAGNGSTGFSGDGGLATQAQLDPFGIAIDGNHNLYIADTGNNRVRVVHLTPAISFAPANPSVGPTDVGVTASTNIQITNSGSDTLTITGASITPAEFGANNGCTGSAAPSQSCTIAVTFDPMAIGTIIGTLTINSNAFGTPNFTIQVTGLTTAPIATLNPAGGSTLTFPAQALGTSATLPVTLTNTGTANLTLSTVTIQPNTDFTETNANCNGPFPPAPAAGSSCTFNVKFSPSALGQRTGTFVVNTNDPNNPSQTINLSGTGISGGTATLNPAAGSTLAFGNEAQGGTSAAQTITLTNTGTGPLAFQRAAVGLAIGQTAQFTPSNNCPASLPPSPQTGSSCTISVVFAPTMLGAIQQQLGIFTDDPNNGFQPINLTGTGVSGFILSIAPGGSPVSNVSPGATAVFPLVLTSSGGFTGTVSLSCMNPTNTINCTVTPFSIPITGSGTTQTAISVRTFCSWLMPPRSAPRNTPGPGGVPTALWLAVFASLALLGTMAAMRPRRRRLVLSLASLVIILGLGASCGDPGPNGATAPGSYPLTITASGRGVTSSVNLTLNVQ
jgi:trimeric autotransporter adhesin